VIAWSFLVWPDIPDSWGFILIFGGIQLLILMEIGGRMILLGFKKFCVNMFNLSDFLLALVITALLVV
jgi:hypothetical protein